MAGKGFNQWWTARKLVLVAIMLLMEVRVCAWVWDGTNVWERQVGLELTHHHHPSNHCPTST